MLKRIGFTAFLVNVFLCTLCFAGPLNPYGTTTNGIISGAKSQIPFLKQRKPELRIKLITTTPLKPKIGEKFEIKVVVENTSGLNLYIPQIGESSNGLTSADKYGPSHHRPVGNMGNNASNKQISIPGTSSEATDLLIKIGKEASPIRFNIPAILPGNTYTVTTNYTAEYPGDLKIECIIDPQNKVKESCELNNTLSKIIHIPGPDFVITDFFINSPNSRVIRVNDTITIYANIENRGDAEAATFMRFNISGTTPNQQKIIKYEDVPVPSLGPHRSTQVFYRFTPSQVGTYIFGGAVNTPIKIHEINELNNTVPKIIKKQIQPAGIDLALVSISSNGTSKRLYQDFKIGVTVLNTGNQPSGSFKVHLYRLHDQFPGIAQGTPLDSFQICQPLRPNDLCHVEFKFKYKRYLGSFDARIVIDPENRINDVNRNNNSKEITLTVSLNP